MPTRRTLLVTLGIFAMLMGMCLSCSATGGLALLIVQERLYPAATITPVAPETITPVAPDMSSEYHRGVYDACTYLYVTGTGASDEDAMRDCNQLVKMIDESGWYEQESNGYEAP